MRIHSFIWSLVLLTALTACRKTAPQQPSQRSGQDLPVDTTMVSLMEFNRDMATKADDAVLAYVDSLQRATGETYALMSCGGWKRRRNVEERQAALYADSPTYRERWEVRLKTFNLNGQLISDVQGTYLIKHYDLPIAIEEALEDMCAGETSDVVAPWYTAYGFRGKGPVGPYENVAFKVTLLEKVN